jgi:hypothetical protein
LRLFVLTMLACLTLAGCDSPKSELEKLTLQQLKDPESAKFGDFGQVLSKERDWACLAVNAKNSFGGYTGEQSARFVKKATEDRWTFQGIAPQSFAECMSMMRDKQPYEGGPR